MLQGRLFAYADAQRYRLGVNYHQIPVNTPLNEVKHYHRDGYGRSDGNGGRSPNYHPNSFDEVTELQDGKAPPYALSGALDRYNQRDDQDYYSQAGALYRLMSEAQRALLTGNIAGAMKSVPELIRNKQIEHFKKADPEYGARVERGLAELLAGDLLRVPAAE